MLRTNGILIILVLMFLEGLNLTGIPAIVIIPTIGFFIGQAGYSFTFVFIISLFGSILGNFIYYLIAYKVGDIIYNYFYSKFSRTQKALDKAMLIGDKHGAKACFIGRLVPGARTFISLISGVFKVKPIDFIIYSALGIGIWNLVLMLIGYSISYFS